MPIYADTPTVTLPLIGNSEAVNNILPQGDGLEAKVHRAFHGTIKSATISKNPSGRYYVSILVDTEIEELPKVDKSIGIDLGIRDFLIDSDGNKVHNPKNLGNYERKLSKLQRKLAKKQPGSNNRRKMRIKVARLHEKISYTSYKRTSYISYLHKL